MNNRAKWLIVAGALAATAAVGYAQYDTYVPAAAKQVSTSKAGQTFLVVFSALQQIYLHKLDPEALLRGATKGMMEATNDRFNYYFSPEDAKGQNEDVKGEFFGIGALIGAKNANGVGAVIDQVYAGQPAARAGLQAGDYIVKVDGQDVTSLTNSQVVSKIRGPKDTTVKLTVQRGSGALVEASMVRAPITIVSVQTSMLPGNVGYIALQTFANEKVEQQFAAAVADMKKKGVQKLILDLRDNGGGLLCNGTFVADQFLQKGSIVSLRDRDGKSEDLGCAGNGQAANQPTDYTGKLVVLINKNSASASEIVAGALQDYGRATIVGEKSYGKGVAQSVLPNLPDGAQVDIVTAEWLTPKGRAIQDKGITPDVTVKDNRYPDSFSVSGQGLPASTKLSVDVGGHKVDVTTDKDGTFTYTAPPQRLPASDKQGVAIVDPSKDAELAKAISLLNQ